MILYALRCANSHQFDAWFRNSASYDAQAAAGEVACPHCGDRQIAKAPMAPNIVKAAPARATPPEERPVEATEDAAKAAATEVVETPAPAAPPPLAVVAAAQEVQRLLTAVRQHVENNCDYVGDRFAEEARRIHYNETAPRGIYGEASADEAEALHEEGVIFQRIPWAARTDS